MSNPSLWQMVTLDVNRRRVEIVELRRDDQRHPFEGEDRTVFVIGVLGMPKPAGFEVEGAALSPWCASRENA